DSLIAVGDSLVFSLTVNVAQAAVPSVTNTATVNTAGDPYAANNTASDLTAVGGAPDLAMAKRHTAAFVDGANGTYTLVVSNVGTTATSGPITVTDPLPAGLSFVSGSGAGRSFAAAGGTVTATNNGSIAVGDSLVFTLTVNVAPAAVPGVINTATVSTSGDPYAANNTASDPTPVGGALDLAMAKRRTAPSFPARRSSDLLVVSNVGTTATSGPITVTDPLPAGLSFVS